MGTGIHRHGSATGTRSSLFTCSSSVGFFFLLFLSRFPSFPRRAGVYIYDLDPYFSIVSLVHHSANPRGFRGPSTPASPSPSPLLNPPAAATPAAAVVRLKKGGQRYIHCLFICDKFNGSSVPEPLPSLMCDLRISPPFSHFNLFFFFLFFSSPNN